MNVCTSHCEGSILESEKYICIRVGWHGNRTVARPIRGCRAAQLLHSAKTLILSGCLKGLEHLGAPQSMHLGVQALRALCESHRIAMCDASGGQQCH